jgi:hypothetical protein
MLSNIRLNVAVPREKAVPLEPNRSHVRDLLERNSESSRIHGIPTVIRMIVDATLEFPPTL